jgi:pyruvate dehydrogenase E1 component alpha subunit
MIGAQVLHATGYALGCRLQGVDSAAVAYFGDGATSKGDVHEAMVFAASFAAPVVLFCQNNQWAISEPVGLQSRRPIADRALGYGIPSLRVDGNDVLAVTAATRIALDRARRGGGPTFVEAVTYRRGPHTTSDDPTRYVDPAVAALWEQRDPIVRVERLLGAHGALTEDRATEIKEKAERFAHDLREGCLALPEPDPASVFAHVLVEPSASLERQRGQYQAYLAMFEDSPTQGAPAQGGGSAR